ncbi:MAG: hypothetical protein JWM05_1539, partial [Acidimicrobiales bacterium]|nr:hypothetical protein [Acidimicrobiales bacterium]
LTRYYVHAVAAARPSPLARLVDDPTCDRRAPLRHWSSGVLGSVAARTSWVEPDLEPLPWRTGA